MWTLWLNKILDKDLLYNNMSVLSTGSNASSHLSVLQERVNQLHDKVLTLTSEKNESKSQTNDNENRFCSLLEKYAEKFNLKKTSSSSKVSTTSSEILPLKKRKKKKKKRIKKGKILGKKAKSKRSCRSSSSNSSNRSKIESRPRKPFLTRTKTSVSRTRRSKKRRKPKTRMRSLSNKPVTKKRRKNKKNLTKSVTRSLTKSQSRSNQVGLTEEYLRRIDIWDGWKAYKERLGKMSPPSKKLEEIVSKSGPSNQNETSKNTNEVFSELTSLPEDSIEEDKIAQIEKLNHKELRNQLVTAIFSNNASSKKEDNSNHSSNSISTSTNTESTRNIEIQTEVRSEETRRSTSNPSISNNQTSVNPEMSSSDNVMFERRPESSNIFSNNAISEEVPIKIRICNVMKDENDREFQKVEVCVTKNDGISQKLDLIIPTSRGTDESVKVAEEKSSSSEAEQSSKLSRSRRRRRRRRRARRKDVEVSSDKGVFSERRNDRDQQQQQQQKHVENNNEDELLMNSFALRKLTKRKGHCGVGESESEEDVVLGDENDITHNSSILTVDEASLDSSFEGSANLVSLKKLMMKYSHMKQ